MLNKIFPLKSNKVAIDFEFAGDFGEDGLNNFTEIEIVIGDETYSTIDNPSNILVDTKSKLILDIADVTSLEDGAYFIEIIAKVSGETEPYLLNGDCGAKLSQPIIVCS